jgi:hypothetical protein
MFSDLQVQTLIKHPGGPDGSGIWAVKNLGLYYQAVVGEDHVRYLPIYPVLY